MRFTIGYWRFTIQNAKYERFEDEVDAHSEVDALYFIQQMHPSSIHIEVIDY